MGEKGNTGPLLTFLQGDLLRLGVPFGKAEGVFAIHDARNIPSFSLIFGEQRYSGRLVGIVHAGEITRSKHIKRFVDVAIEIKAPEAFLDAASLAQATLELKASKDARASPEPVLLLLTDGARNRVLYFNGKDVVYSDVLSWEEAVLRLGAFLMARAGRGREAPVAPAPAAIPPVAAAAAGPSSAPAASAAPVFPSPPPPPLRPALDAQGATGSAAPAELGAASSSASMSKAAGEAPSPSVESAPLVDASCEEEEWRRARRMNALVGVGKEEEEEEGRQVRGMNAWVGAEEEEMDEEVSLLLDSLGDGLLILISCL